MPTYYRRRRRYPYRYRGRYSRSGAKRKTRFGTKARKTYRKKAYRLVPYTRKWIPTTLTPSKKIVRIVWTARVVWNVPAGGNILMDTYGANTPFDPSQTGGAPGADMQPVGWDQLALAYGRYTPVSSKITWQLCDMSSDVGSCMFQCYLSYSSTLKGITDIIQATGEPLKKSRLKVFGNPERYSVNFRGGKLTYSAKKFWNVSDLFNQGIGGNPHLQSASTGNDITANGKAYYHLCLQAINPAIDLTDIFGIVKISYIVIFHDWLEHEDQAEA